MPDRCDTYMREIKLSDDSFDELDYISEVLSLNGTGSVDQERDVCFVVTG